MIITDHGVIPPEKALKLEERLFSKKEYGIVIYTRDRPTVSLGRFNRAEECVNTDFAEKNGITIVRRKSGGSAIYSDSGQLVFSMILPRSEFDSKMDSYKIACNCLIRTLAHLGITAEFKPRNDVLVNGKKISGCAQFRDRDTLLHHGTLILSLDSEMMDGVLRPVKERKYPGMTSVEEVLGKIPERKKIIEAFEKGFEDLR